MKHLSLLSIFLVTLFVNVNAQSENNFSEYGAGLTISPFGPSLNLTHNMNAKNSISIGFGFSPEVQAPDAMLPDFSTGNYSVTGSTSWMGVFWRHRPFEGQKFGVNVGMASGQIENNLEAEQAFHAGEDPATYSVKYTENPVMYIGVNYSTPPVKGIQFGFDLGVLSTGGASVLYTGHEEELDEHGEEIEAAIQDIQEKFAWSMLPNIQLSIAYGF